MSKLEGVSKVNSEKKGIKADPPVVAEEKLALHSGEQDEIEKIKEAQNHKEGETNPSREQIILEYVPFVKFIAHRMAKRLPSYIKKSEIDNMINAGVIGLMDAVEKFDPSKEIKFKTYAEFRIRGAIRDDLRSKDWLPRSVRRKINLLSDTYADLEQKLGRPAKDEEMAKALDMELEEFQELLNQAGGVSLISLDELVENRKKLKEREQLLWENISAGSPGDDFLTKVHTKEIKKILTQAIDKLSPKEKMVISLYYYEELTMKEIGKIMGFKDESRISQLHTEAILRLRKKLRLYKDELSEEKKEENKIKT